MRPRNVICLGLLLVSLASWRPLAAQAPAPRSQLALDVGLLAAGLSYAHPTRAGNLVGVGAGVGAEFNIRLVVGEQGGKKSTEIAHVEMFRRIQPPGRWQYDVGVKLAADIHSAQAASEADAGGFLGAYVAPMWGSRQVRIGPRIQSGLYWSADGPTFGIFITPLTARLLF